MVLMVRRGIAVGLAVGACWLVGLIGGAGPGFGECVQGGLVRIVHFASAYPLYVAAGAAILLLPAAIAKLTSLIPHRVVKDPRRLFTAAQRASASARAGGRCEMEGVFFTRCRRTGEHGDHWIPHTVGGATNLANEVWACAPCNLSKGSRVPTRLETARLERRRRRYFPPGADVRAGSTYGR